MTYLIIRLATLGNVAMTVPVIASLSRRYPNDRFIVASKKKLGAMFASLPNVVFWEVDNHLNWRGVWSLWRHLRHEADVLRGPALRSNKKGLRQSAAGMMPAA